MIKYALDTNIVSYILRKGEKLIQRLNEERISGNERTTVDDADILIAAFCIKHGLTPVTNNLKHFEDIEELPLANWLS